MKCFCLALSLILSTFFLAGCDSNGSISGANAPGTSTAPPPAPPASPPDTLTDSLNQLGVETEQPPRVDENGNEIPESYAPMGRKVVVREVQNDDGTTRMAIGPLQELFVVGLQASGSNCPDCAISLIDDAAIAVDYANAPPTIYQRTEPAPWALEQKGDDDFPETLRDGAKADIDGDGLDELVVVYLDAASNELRLSIVDTNSANTNTIDELIPVDVNRFPISDIRLASGNFDDDIADELAVGISRRSLEPEPANSAAYVLIIDDQDHQFDTVNEFELVAIDNSRSISLVLETGSLDYDGPMELVVVQNETGRGSVSGREIPGIGGVGYANVGTQYYIFDDVTTAQGPVATGVIGAEINVSTDPDAPAEFEFYQALVSDIDIGDIDNDALDEIVFGGIVDYWANNNCYDVGHVLRLVDDLVHQLDTLDQSYFEVGKPNCPEFDGVELKFAYVNLLDIDGDQNLEVQLNQHIFTEFPTRVVNWPVAYKLPDTIIFRRDEPRAFYDRTNGLITTGDITGDGRDDVVAYKKDFAGESLDVFGLEEDEQGLLTMQRLEQISLISQPDGDQGTNPVIVPVDADTDGDVMVSLSTYDFALTQPLPVAVLAAPPCQNGIGQNIDSCTTTWGQSTTVGIEFGAGVELSVAGTFGTSFDQSVCVALGVGTCTTAWEASVKFTVERKLSLSAGQAYELTKTVAYTTGPLEDSIVFTTIPMDIYYYKLVSGDAESLGREYAMALPREPITFLVETEYYNANVEEGSLRINEDVFTHSAGEIDSYPTAADKITILADRRSQVAQVRLDNLVPGNTSLIDNLPLPALPGLDVGPVSVGEGGGSTEVGIDLVRNSSFSAAIAQSFSLDVEVTTAKVIAGFKIGAGTSANLSVSKGQSTIYKGSVGNIEAANFAANQYQFGLFSYLQADPDSGQEYQVINYWVE